MGQIAGRSVKKAEAYNFFAEILGRPPVALKMGRHRLRKLLTRAVLNDDTDLSEEEEEEVIGIVTRNMRSISESRPERLVRLKNDLELANLENFIGRFRGMLEEGHSEAVWQEFFEANPLILSLVFGCPIIKVGTTSVCRRPEAVRWGGENHRLPDEEQDDKQRGGGRNQDSGRETSDKRISERRIFTLRYPVRIDGAGTRSEVSVSKRHFRNKGQERNSGYRNLRRSMLPCSRNDAGRSRREEVVRAV